MNEEEKKAIENLKEINQAIKYRPMFSIPSDTKLFDTILNLIEKQQKEIEELKQIKCKLDEKNIPIETLLAEFERLEDLEDDLTTVYLNGVYDGEKKAEDKIKAKIEENKWAIEHYNCDEADYKQSQAVGAWNVLQRLLKESEIWNEKKID